MQEYARQYQATLASVNSFDSWSTITNNTNTTINQTINNASDMSFYNAMNKRNTQI
jgi:hypothetical protein